MTFRLLVVLGLISLMIAAGCQVSSNTTPTSSVTTSSTLYYSATPDSGPLIAVCKADLAEITGLTEADVSLISVTAAEFSDTSLGCPEPGKSYAQVITPGYIIILQANGKQYEYHTDQHEAIVLCGTAGNLSTTANMVLETADSATTTNPQNTQPSDETKPSDIKNDTMLVDGGPNQPIEGGDVVITTSTTR